MAKKRDCPRHFPLFPFVVRSCHKHSFLHASFFCLAVSARNLTIPVIPLSISFRLFLISRAFLFVCPTCLSPRQRLRRGRVVFSFLPFHAAFGERDAPWLFTLYCRALSPGSSSLWPARLERFFASLVLMLGGIGEKLVRFCHFAFHFLPSFPGVASFSFGMFNLPISNAVGPQGPGVFSFPLVSCRLVRTRRPLASFTIW